MATKLSQTGKCCLPRKRGRPVQMDHETRETAVLDATVDLLSTLPLDAVSMAAIARRAGMSKRTLYTMFESREELLGACLDRFSESLFRELSPQDRDHPLEQRLRILLTLNESPNIGDAPLEVLRAAITEARTYPQLACRMLDNGHCRIMRHLEVELTGAVRSGELALREEDCPEAAKILMDMVFGNAVLKLLNPEMACDTTEARAARRDMAIALFLNGTRPR